MAAIVRVFRAVTCRWREGQIAWILHRITGLGVFIFLLLHIVDIFLMSFGSEVFESPMFFYHQFIFKLGILFGLYPGPVYHGLNGIRVLIIDFWPGVGKKQAELWRVQVAIFTIITTKCIVCGACTSACPSFWGTRDYIGPAAIVQAHRFIFDSRDRGANERLEILNDRDDVWRCRTIFNCVGACPRSIDVTRAIGEIKKLLLFNRMV